MNLKEKLQNAMASNPTLYKIFCCFMLSHRMCSIYECKCCTFYKFKKGLKRHDDQR